MQKTVIQIFKILILKFLLNFQNFTVVLSLQTGVTSES